MQDAMLMVKAFLTYGPEQGIEPELASARLALVGKAQQVIRHALGILGISAPEKM